MSKFGLQIVKLVRFVSPTLAIVVFLHRALHRDSKTKMFFFNENLTETWYKCTHCAFYSDVRRTVESHSRKSHYGRPVESREIEVKTVGKYLQKFIRLITAREDLHVQSRVLLHIEVDGSNTQETRVVDRNLSVDICLCFPAFRHWFLMAIQGLRNRGAEVGKKADLIHRLFTVKIGWAIHRQLSGIFRGKEKKLFNFIILFPF